MGIRGAIQSPPYIGCIRASDGRITVLPAGWSIADNTIAEYKKDGGYDYLKPLKEGRTTLTATEQGDSDNKVSVPIEVWEPVPNENNTAWFVIENGKAALYQARDEWNGVIPAKVTKGSKNYPVTKIRNGSLSMFEGTTISIPSTVTDIDDKAFCECTSVTTINVASSNPVYSSKDGVLFRKTDKTLCFYPTGKTNKKYAIPDGTRKISSKAFYNLDTAIPCLDDLYIPESTNLDNARNVFSNFLEEEDIEDLTWTITLHFVGNNSDAVEYAERCGLDYEKGPSLAKPKNPSAELYKSYDDVKFSWARTVNAAGYYVYYKKSTSSSWTYLGKTTGTYVLKKNLSDGVKYYFRVYPYLTIAGENYRISNYNTGSGIYTLKTVNRPSISKNSSRYIKVKWSNISGETGYQIARSKYKTKKYSVVKTASYKYSSAKIKTKKRTTYYYKIRAYKTVGKSKIYGPWSSYRAYKLK